MAGQFFKQSNGPQMVSPWSRGRPPGHVWPVSKRLRSVLPGVPRLQRPPRVSVPPGGIFGNRAVTPVDTRGPDSPAAGPLSLAALAAPVPSCSYRLPWGPGCTPGPGGGRRVNSPLAPHVEHLRLCPMAKTKGGGASRAPNDPPALLQQQCGATGVLKGPAVSSRAFFTSTRQAYQSTLLTATGRFGSLHSLQFQPQWGSHLCLCGSGPAPHTRGSPPLHPDRGPGRSPEFEGTTRGPRGSPSRPVLLLLLPPHAETHTPAPSSLLTASIIWCVQPGGRRHCPGHDGWPGLRRHLGRRFGLNVCRSPDTATHRPTARQSRRWPGDLQGQSGTRYRAGK
ncbi:hypothetical protein NDU88_006620 [Pleurodeles waltl]|uniref:Uncharacterized protein n=1 Tax=Pleurodeles waltl TaxID=8319 RepID=A0AAV7TXR1_PLEWA|nr:hypothetical protein NDU88_006620 [Pleurodeles waltl]